MKKLNRFYETMQRQANKISASSDESIDKSYVDTKIAQLVDSAPDDLDTLNELAVALKENKNVVETLNKSITSKEDKSTVSSLTTKVTANENNIKLKADKTYVDDKIKTLATTEQLNSKTSGLATTTYVDNKVANLATSSSVSTQITSAKDELNGEIDALEKLVKETATDIEFDDNGEIVLKHDTMTITEQTPLSLGAMKGPIKIVNITAAAEAKNGTITDEQLKTLQFSEMNMVMFNHEVYILMDKGHTEGFLTYSHVGYENNLTYIKTFTITISTKSWVLNVNPIPKFEYNEEDKTLNITG